MEQKIKELNKNVKSANDVKVISEGNVNKAVEYSENISLMCGINNPQLRR